MANLADLSGSELLFGYMTEYMDGDLPQPLAGAFTAILEKNPKAVENFQQAKGRFQIAIGKIAASEPLKHKLRNLIQEDSLRETMEASEILDIERSELMSNIIRRTSLTALVLGVIGAGIYMFMPTVSEKINVIEYIGYEAVAMEEDPDGRINLPTNDLEEIRQFIGNVPGLSFKPQALKPLLGWIPEGVSIIDYDVTKVISVMYKSPDRNNEHLHHFTFQGALQDIPYGGEEADYRGLRYRTYASEKLNMLVWQFAPGTVSVLAGHRSAPELAELARMGTPE